jgi:signal peptidase I
MQPAINSGDGVVVRTAENFSRGDVAMYRLDDKYKTYFTRAGQAFNAPFYSIGRVVGLPTETVEIRSGHLFIEDKEIPEDYVANDNRFDENFEKRRLPVNRYFILKDSRKAGVDSRHFDKLTNEQVSLKVVKTYKSSSLNLSAWFEVAAGVIMILSFFYVPYYLYNHLSDKTALFGFTRSSGLGGVMSIHFSAVFAYIYTILIASYKETNAAGSAIVRGLPMYFLQFYHNLLSWLEFLFMSSPVATVLTVGFAWLGGIMSFIQLAEKVNAQKQSPSTNEERITGPP